MGTNLRKNNYDAAAWFYDRLSHLVFGRQLVKAQTAFVDRIVPGSRVLIVGGGTGLILEHLAKTHQERLNITYVEISLQMIHLAQKRDTGAHHVQFIHHSIEDYQITEPFDVIMTAFLFDNFSEETAGKVFHQLDGLLQTSGTWLYTDFMIKPGAPFLQRILVKTMYVFFGWLCHVEARKLPDVGSLFEKYRYRGTVTGFANGMVLSCCYQKRAG